MKFEKDRCMKRFSVIGIMILLALVFASCGQSTPPATVSQPTTAVTKAAPQQQTWEVEWQKTVEAAKQEGRITLYTTAGPQIRDAFTKAMKDKYGLEMEYVTGRGVEIITKMLNERRAKLYLGDAYMAGATSAIDSLVPEGVIDSMNGELVLPEVTDTSKWMNNKLPWVDQAHRFLGFRGSPFWSYTRNTDLVKAEDVASYKDLLKPAFKGKIAMGDPTITGASNSFVAVVSLYLLNRDYIRQLVAQEPILSRDERQVTEWVARGKYSVLIGTTPDPITEFMKAGAPLQPMVAKEGTMIEPGAGTMSLMNGRPHPNATRLFLNWLLSKEGQTVYAQAAGTESAREDVPKTFAGGGLVREPGKQYIFGDEEFRAKGSQAVKESQEDFKPLLK